VTAIAPRPSRVVVPERRYRLKLDLQADSLDELGRALGQLETDLAIGDLKVTPDRASGGVTYGYHLELTEPHPGRTHEEYADLLDAWRREDCRLRDIANRPA
jgi:hypothetical protein